MIWNVLAAAQNEGPKCEAFVFSGCTNIQSTINAGIQTANALAILLAVLFLAVGGIKYITATGNKEKAGEAKQLLTQVLIGLAVVLCINVILQVLTNITGSGNTITTPAAPSIGKPATT